MKTLLVAVVLSIGFAGFAEADLAKRINGVISRSSQKKVRFSICIVKADTGKTVYSHSVNEAMVPASNMKVIISAAALKYLGENYEYKTRVGLCSDTLVVIGGGDPLLGDRNTDVKYGRESGWIFEDIAVRLKRIGITNIKDIVVDSSVFDDQRVHSNWPVEQLNRSYACEVGGLNFNGNCIEVTAKNTGGKVSIIVEPQTDFVKIKNEVKAINKGKSAVGSYRQSKPNEIVVFGRCKKRAGPFEVAIERPAAYFGFLLAENLARAGINTSGQLIEKSIDQNCKFKLLSEYRTPIANCLGRCNKDSFGLAAEALFKTIAAANNSHGKNGSWTEGRKVVRGYLLALGVKEGEFYIDDGSGLCKENKLSANAITKVLLDMYKGSSWQIYKQSLAVGGVEGTVGKYFKEQKYRGKIFGKTGYIKGVKAFSGVCSAADGDYIFSILANNTNGRTRRAINDIVKVIID